MSEVKAGVVVVNRFCRSGSKEFKSYIDYIDREEAKRKENFYKFSLYNDYMGNPEKTTGLFTQGKYSLTKEEKKKLKECFSLAEDNGSNMWQTVISFDNRWLHEHNLLNIDTNELDDNKLKEIVSGAVGKMLKNEKLQNAVWSGSIHYNTDNIHVHIAITEPYPEREKKKYNVYDYKEDRNGAFVCLSNGEYVKANERNMLNKWGVPYPRFNQVLILDTNGNVMQREEYVGRFKESSIKDCKRYVVNEIIQQKENNYLINKIIREQIVKGKKNIQFSEDLKLRIQFLELHKKMPDVNRNMWNYNNSVMMPLREEIDRLSLTYIELYHKDEYEELKDILKKQSEEYRKAYGETDQEFEQGKIKDLYERMGNAILKEVRQFDKIKDKSDLTELRYEPEINIDTEKGLDFEEENIESFVDYEIEISDSVLEKVDQQSQYINNKKTFEKGKFILRWSPEYKKANKLIHSKNPDYEKARKLLEKDAANGNVLAVYELGNIFKFGRGCEIDLKEAEQFYKKAYSMFEELVRDPQYHKYKGYIYYRMGKQQNQGLGVQKDYDRAKDYFEKAGNNSYAKYSLGNMYFYGQGMDIDYAKALDHYKEAVKIKPDNAYALYKVAEIYENGSGTEKDEKKAKENYKKAFEVFEQMGKKQGDDNTKYRLGMMLLKGKGVDIDTVKATKYLEEAANEGNTHAQYQLAKIYMASGEEEKVQKAIELLKNSAIKGKNNMAQYALGKYYLENGEIREAIKWFEKSSARKNMYASYQLGCIYVNENGEFFDPVKGMDYLIKCADENNQYAQVKLGLIYLQGNVGTQDIQKAKEYLGQAAEQGNVFAQQLLENIEKNNGKNIQKKSAISKGRFRFEMDRAMCALKKSLHNECEKYLNMREFERLEYEEQNKERKGLEI